MSKRILLCAVLSILLESIGSSGLPIPAREQSPDENERCGCLIVGLQGKADLRTENSAKFVSAQPNMTVFVGDSLRVGVSSKITLHCGEGYKELTSGVHPVQCNPRAMGGPFLIAGRIFDSATTRGTPDASFPRLLSPRKTWLLDTHPKLRWTPVPNATKYTVRVRGPRVDWSNIVTSTETVYPDNAPALLPGQQYNVIVFAGGRNSDEEGVLGLGFRILEAEQAAKVKAREREIRNMNLQESSKRLLIAYLYAGRELYAEAIMQLEEGSNDPEVVRLLAELYLRTLLTDKAERQYLRAIELSRENILGLALAHDRLGQIYEAFVKKGDQGKKDQAIQKYENAIKAYMDLKNWKMVGEIAGRLAGLQKP